LKETTMARIWLAAAVLAAACATGFGAEAPKLQPGVKWFHVMTNLANEDALNKLIQLMERASKAGYNGITVNDVKLIKYHLMGPEYVANLKKFRQACRDLHIQCVPCVMPMGYSEFILAHDPNLAEGMPVRDALFVVKDGRLVPDPGDCPGVVNPSFEEFDGNRPKGWEVDDPGTISFIDADVKSDGKASVRQQDVANQKQGRGRVMQKMTVKPWHYYHVSVRVKTEDCKNRDMRLMAIGNGGFPLNWQPLEASQVKPTMDWRRVDATFNSLESTEITLYMGTWNPKTGRIWWDDVKVEPGGFVNVIRRDSLPLTVKGLDGATVFVEGKDFSKVLDERLVNDPPPHPGYFTNWHEAPVVTIPAGSRLKEGDKVLASYNHATAAGKENQITVCMSEPALYPILEKEIVWLRDNLQPDAYFMAHDEIRQQGWDDTCVKTGKTCGEILAENARRCAAIIEKVDPGKPIVVWSDCFDAFHNARRITEDGAPFRMYLDKTPWWGSWEGLPKQVGIMNWSGGKPDSFKFFADLGHQQIISGVDAKKIGDWLKAVGSNPGVVGVMYTTWDGDFGKNFEAYIDAVKQWEKETGGFKP
jgi:hypothetical protein